MWRNCDLFRCRDPPKPSADFNGAARVASMFRLVRPAFQLLRAARFAPLEPRFLEAISKVKKRMIFN